MENYPQNINIYAQLKSFLKNLSWNHTKCYNFIGNHGELPSKEKKHVTSS